MSAPNAESALARSAVPRVNGHKSVIVRLNIVRAVIVVRQSEDDVFRRGIGKSERYFRQSRHILSNGDGISVGEAYSIAVRGNRDGMRQVADDNSAWQCFPRRERDREGFCILAYSIIRDSERNIARLRGAIADEGESFCSSGIGGTSSNAVERGVPAGPGIDIRAIVINASKRDIKNYILVRSESAKLKLQGDLSVALQRCFRQPVGKADKTVIGRDSNSVPCRLGKGKALGKRIAGFGNLQNDFFVALNDIVGENLNGDGRIPRGRDDDGSCSGSSEILALRRRGLIADNIDNEVE